MADITRSVRIPKRPRNPGKLDLVESSTLPPYNIEYLVVGGGGGDGGEQPAVSYRAGGGGGQVLSGTKSDLTRGVQVSITVGAAGPVGVDGGNSIFSNITAVGGHTAQPPGTGGASGNGNAGGVKGSGTAAGGGGGAGGVGGNGTGNSPGGNGGAPVSSSITGTPTNYGSGGFGGGSTNNGTSTACAYGGGCGAYASNSQSGCVILKILTSDYSGVYTGSPSISTDGGYTILTFTGNGSYTP